MGIPIIGDIIDAVKDLASEVIVDKDKRNELNLELEKLRDIGNARMHAEILAQLEINKEEAKNGSIFVAGWRPFIGWVCGAGLAAQVILLPVLTAITDIKFEFDMELMLLTMSGMLGIGAMRSYEKVKGVSTNDYTDTPKPVEPVKSVQERAKAVIFGPRKEVVQPLPEEAPWNR